MKWLLVLLAVLGGLWWLRQSRRDRGDQGRASASPSAPASSPQDMTRCLYCGLHLPREDATTGAQGDYCSPSHQQLHERA